MPLYLAFQLRGHVFDLRVFSKTTQTSLFTVSTQAGFLIFALYSSYINLTGKYELHHIITCASICAALFNCVSVILPGNTFGFFMCLVSRALVGGCTALIYPTSMKVLGSWVKEPEKEERFCVFFWVCFVLPWRYRISFDMPCRSLIFEYS